MSKNKFKLISVLTLIIILVLTPFVKAENETTPSENAADAVVTSEGGADTQAPVSQENGENVGNEQTPENTTSNANENTLKKSDIYLSGDNVTIDYIIDGNLFVSANTVTISSQIGGDAFIFANNVKLTEQGAIFGNLFSISQDLQVNGTVYDVYALSKTTTISGFIYRDIKISSETTNIFGTIRRNAFINTKSLNFSQEVNMTDENAATPVTSQGSIQGNLTYSAPNEISISDENVKGEKNYEESPSLHGNTVQSYIMSFGIALATVLIIWLLCLWLAPKFLEKTTMLFSKKILPVIGFGILGLIAIPIISIILLILGITVSIGFLLFGIYMILLGMSAAIFIIAVNNLICKRLKITKNMIKVGTLILCTAILWAVELIPFVGAFVTFVVVTLGLGIILYSLLAKK